MVRAQFCYIYRARHLSIDSMKISSNRMVYPRHPNHSWIYAKSVDEKVKGRGAKHRENERVERGRWSTSEKTANKSGAKDEGKRRTEKANVPR